jgi:DNA modification methylase
MIITGDSLKVLKTLPDQSVNCIVTSPPYWGLRQYLPDKVRLRENITEKELITLKNELSLLGLNDIIRL